MGIMAKWGPKIFQVSPSQITALEGLTTSLTLKEDSENDTSGTQPVNTRGRELRPISFKVTYLLSAGVDPRTECEEWESLLGFKYPLYVGDQRFGSERMKLKEVETSNILLSNSGRFLQATATIKLEEYSEGKISKLISFSTTSSNSTNTQEKERAAALNATASSSDRATRGPNSGKG